MIYDIQHVTTYHYGARVTFARCLLHLEPRGTAGQRVLSHSVGIEPKPVETPPMPISSAIARPRRASRSRMPSL